MKIRPHVVLIVVILLKEHFPLSNKALGKRIRRTISKPAKYIHLDYVDDCLVIYEPE